LLPGVPFLSRGAEAERIAVEALGSEAFATAMAEGAALDLDAASAEALSAFGGNGGSGRRPTSGWQSLTAAEWRVAELAASGRSNPQIADDLFISRETVKSHMSRVFAKLAVTNRAELAAAWARRR
jgi:DNA-binding CsgD family transcriptional regulator